MSDPNFYRYYDCNIRCPKMKARTMRADTLLASSVETNDLDTQSLTTNTLEATTITAGSINTNAISGDLVIDKLEADEICSTPGDVCFYSGSSSALASTHTITSSQLPKLANPNLSGTLTLFLQNDVYINTTMAAVVKVKGTISKTLVYQRVGNYDSVDMTSSGNNLVITTSPASWLRWIFMGV